jgi:hypothetical protein
MAASADLELAVRSFEAYNAMELIGMGKRIDVDPPPSPGNRRRGKGLSTNSGRLLEVQAAAGTFFPPPGVESRKAARRSGSGLSGELAVPLRMRRCRRGRPMPRVERDSEELRKILDHHSVKGYPVLAPVFGAAVIIQQEGTGPVRRYTETSMELGSPQVAYLVKPAREFPFSEWVKAKGLSTTPMDYKQWIEKYGHRTRKEILPMLMEMREDLERGVPVSEAQAEFGLMQNAGCVGPDETITCATFWADQVKIPPEMLKRGMLVECHDDKKGDFPGRIVGFEDDRKIALLEVFTPVPFMESPRSIVNRSIRKGFYSSKTYSIGYGLRHAFEDAGFPLPPGKKSDADGRQYVLDELMDLSIIEDFCKKNYPDEGHCVWMALILYIIPIDLKAPSEFRAEFHPLPEHAIPSEYVVDYEHE